MQIRIVPHSFFEIFQSKNPLNYSQYGDLYYDKLVNQAGSEIDPAKQYNLYIQAERHLVDTEGEGEAAFIPLYYSSKIYVQRNSVVDLYRHPYGPEYTLKWAYT